MTRHGVPLDGSVFTARYQGEPLRRGRVRFLRRKRYLARFVGYQGATGRMRFEFSPELACGGDPEVAGVTYRDIWSFMREWAVVTSVPATGEDCARFSRPRPTASKV